MSNSNGNHSEDNVYPLSNYGFKVIEKPSKSSFWKLLSWRNLLIILLVMMVISSTILGLQYKKYANLQTKEAYVISAAINLIEDNMFLKYGVFPKEVGLADLRSDWINSPNYETAKAYFEALEDKYEILDTENESKPAV